MTVFASAGPAHGNIVEAWDSTSLQTLIGIINTQCCPQIYFVLYLGINESM